LHYAFGALGIVGLTWVVAWLILGKEGPCADPAMAASEPRIPYFQLLTSRTFVGCVRTFGAYWRCRWADLVHAVHHQGLGFSQQQAGFISILPWVFAPWSYCSPVDLGR